MSLFIAVIIASVVSLLGAIIMPSGNIKRQIISFLLMYASGIIIGISVADLL